MSANRFEVTKEIYLGNSELSTKNFAKKTMPKPIVESIVLKPKRHNTFNSKETVSSNNSARTVVLKQKTGSISHLMNGNESTLPLTGQCDSPGHQKENKASEAYSNEKRQSVGTIIEKHERNLSGNLAITGSNGTMLKIETENAKIRAEIAKLTAFIEKERKVIAQYAEKDKEIIELSNKLKMVSENIEMIKNTKSKLSNTLPELNKIPSFEENKLGQKGPVHAGRKIKIFHPFKKTLNMEFNISDQNQALDNFQKRPNPINLPFSAKSSSRGIPVKETSNISSARNFERASSGGRSSPSKFLIRKFSDQGHDFFSSQTFNSSRENPSNDSKPGVKDTKERLFKISRIIGSRNQKRQEFGTSTSCMIEGDLKPRESESNNTKIDHRLTEKPGEEAHELFYTLINRVDTIFRNYFAIERALVTKNQKLLKILDQKLKDLEFKKSLG